MFAEQYSEWALRPLHAVDALVCPQRAGTAAAGAAGKPHPGELT